jgi:hypothetical protein
MLLIVSILVCTALSGCITGSGDGNNEVKGTEDRVVLVEFFTQLG